MRRLVLLIAIIVGLASAIENFNYRTTLGYAQDTSYDCENSPPPRLDVGQYARVLQSGGLEQYDGEPYMGTIQKLIYPFNTPKQLAVNDVMLVLEGPVCHDGGYLWRFRFPNREPDETSPISVWLYEAKNGQYSLEPISSVANSKTNYTVPETVLLPPTSAPLIDPQQQIIFVHNAGGGSGMGCLVGEGGSSIYYKYAQDRITDWGITRYDCIIIYPFQVGDPVEVIIHQPDGQIYSTNSLPVEVDDNLEGNSASIPDHVGFVRVFVPNYSLKLPAGIWTIDLFQGSEKRQVAYELKPPPAPAIWNECDDYEPVIMIAGFKPFENINLSVSELSSLDYSYGPPSLPGDLKQLKKWNLQVGPRGDLMAYLDFTAITRWIPIGEVVGGQYFTVSTGQEPVELSLSFPADWWACPAPISEAEAKSNLLEYGAVVTGLLGEDSADFGSYQDAYDFGSRRKATQHDGQVIYAFEGSAGDLVSIDLVGLSSTLDPFLQLKDPNGTIIAENDDSENPEYGSYDSNITNFTIPADGIYSIVVDKVSGDGGYALLLDEANHSRAEVSPDTTLNPPEIIPSPINILPTFLEPMDTTNVEQATQLLRLDELPLASGSISFSQDETAFAILNPYVGVVLWNLETNSELFHKFFTFQDNITLSLDWSTLASSNTQIMYEGNSRNLVQIWNLAKGEQVTAIEIDTQPGSISDLTFSPNAELIAIGGFGELALWEVSSGKNLASLQSRGNAYIYHAIFSPDGSSLATADGEGAVKLWDVPTGAESILLQPNNSYTESIIFSRDGRMLAASRDNTVYVWNTATLEPVVVLPEFGSVPQFSSDSSLLAAILSDQHVIHLWSIAAESEVTPLECGTERSLSFSPNGTLLASACGYGVVLWDVQKSTPVKILAHNQLVREVAFSPDGKLLFSMSGTEVRIWGIPKVDSAPEAQPTPGVSAAVIDIFPEQTPIFAADASTLSRGKQVTVHVVGGDELNVRSDASLDAAILERLSDGIKVKILGGPRIADGYTWWRIRTPSGVKGWAVESADGIQTLVP